MSNERRIRVTVDLYLSRSEEEHPLPSEKDAAVLMRVALRALRNDGYEHDQVVFEDFDVVSAVIENPNGGF